MRILTTVLLLAGATVCLSQDFSDQFNKFKTGNELAYDKLVRQRDSIFAKSIVDNWKSLQLEQPEEKKTEVPKPEAQPVAESSLELMEVQHKVIPDERPKLMRSFNQPKLEYDEEYDDFEMAESYEFHGESISLRYSSQFLAANALSVSDEFGLSKAWQTLSRSPYQNIVKSLYEKAQEMNLPDYGYLLLTESFLDQLNISDAHRPVYQWFLLQKSGYVARVGLINKSPVLVIGCYGKIYGKRFYSLSGVNYYVLSDEPGQFESFQSETSDESNLFDFSLSSEIKLPLDPVKKNFNYLQKSGKNVSLDIYYNQNMVKLLGSFPQCDLRYYLTSSSSDLMKKSVEKSFDEHMSGKSEVEKVQFLLEFVQKAIDYQSDKIQFGKEKVMYPEEVLFYDFADCDDRVVLLNYLIRTFTDVPVVVVSFPQHVALAVRLPSPTFGETISYKGYTFTFCDPTYLNSPLGSVIPQADRSKIEVIEF
ncbi:MAG: hypothetical protein ABJG41_02760 [Cyclobacteriaceae bacterium]